MKMTFQIKHAKILAILLLVFILILIFSFFGSVRSLVSDIFSPFFKIGNCFYKSIGQLNGTENNQPNLADYESIKYENQKLREALGMRPAENFITATIMARSPQIPLDSLFLDKGTLDGLNEGDLVLAGERILVGKIVKVSKNKSTVALNSFAEVVSYGFVARTNEPLEIKGVGGGSLEAKVPIDFDIVVGDKLMIPGLFPYLAAVVGVIEEDRPSGFKNILMSLPIDVSKVDMVFVEPHRNE